MIDWAPKTTGDEVLQNVRTLLKTEPGTVPFSRALGTPQDSLDLPETTVSAKIRADIIRAVRTYEPRAPIKNIPITSVPPDTVTR